jgi:hypothetical protein
LLEIQNVGGDRLGKLLRLATGFGGALIEESEHAVLEKPPGLVADGRALYSGLLAAGRDRFGKQHNGTNHFVVVLQRVGKAQFQLVKIIG